VQVLAVRWVRLAALPLLAVLVLVLVLVLVPLGLVLYKV
jgi:hypothetical protein